VDPELPKRSLRISADHFQRPGVARMWDYWLGGTDNFPLDRVTGDAIAEHYPRITEVALSSRRFLSRCVRHLAKAGVDQFLDIGAGLPTGENTHEIAQSIAPSATVVYVDNDPMVLGRAKARSSRHRPAGSVFHLGADARDADLILGDARAVVDFRRPVAVLMLGVLGYTCPTFDDVRALLDQYLAALGPGSYLAYRDGVHLDGADPAAKEQAARFGYHLRSPEGFRSCFDGLQLVPPGVVPQHLWHPDPDQTDVPVLPDAWAGAGRVR
jgi:hypothetical protein